jgi:hypothetical protein
MKEAVMAAEPPVPDVRILWKNQADEGGRVSVDDIRRASRKLEETVARRARLVYLAGAGNAGLPLVLMWFLPELRLALAWLVVTAVVLVSYVRRRSAFQSVSPDSTADQGLTFYRRLLERERDFRHSSTRWFTIGPALNIAVLMIAYTTSPLFHGTVPELAAVAVILATHVVVLAHAVRRLRREARAYQLELDALGRPIA